MELTPEQLAEARRQIAQELGRKGGRVKSERKKLAGQKNIAKASKRLAEIRAAKRVLAGLPPMENRS